jgi:hypothetical protein
LVLAAEAVRGVLVAMELHYLAVLAELGKHQQFQGLVSPMPVVEVAVFLEVLAHLVLLELAVLAVVEMELLYLHKEMLVTELPI